MRRLQSGRIAVILILFGTSTASGGKRASPLTPPCPGCPRTPIPQLPLWGKNAD